MSDNPFTSDLSRLVSKTLRGADADQCAEIIERLTNALGLAIAVGARGDQAAMSTMLIGVEQHLNECAADHIILGKLAAMLAARESGR